MRRAVSTIGLVVLIGLVAGCVHVTRTEPAAAPRVTVVVPTGTSAVVVQTAPWCGGGYAPPTGTNFGGCGPVK